MKTLLLILLASFGCPPRSMIIEKWAIEKQSNLYFEGKSNVSDFCCGIMEYLRPDTLCFYSEDQYQPVISVKGGLTVDVNNFDCKQPFLNKDLKKTLKAKERPEMKVNLQTIGNFSGAVKNVKGMVTISLAGVTRSMEVDYTVQHINKCNLRLKGHRQVSLSDFCLTPPRKLAGLVKVDEKIDVHFLLVLRALNK